MPESPRGLISPPNPPGAGGPPDSGDPALPDWQDGSVEPVVRRRLLRPEILVLVAGLAFLAGAVLKPWGDSGPASRAAASSSDVPAPLTAQATPGDSASPLSADQASQGSPRPVPYGHPQSWADVSWQVLKTTDTHAQLGISTVGLTFVPSTGPFLNDPPAPKVVWNSWPGNDAAPVVTIPSHGYVFAIAATWPRTLDVTDVSITYLAPIDTQTLKAPPTPVQPVAGNEVVLTAPSASPSPSPIRSGQFWVPPSVYSGDISPSTLALVWQLGPWSWPPGEYEITLTTATGQVEMRLFLEQGA